MSSNTTPFSRKLLLIGGILAFALASSSLFAQEAAEVIPEVVPEDPTILDYLWSYWTEVSDSLVKIGSISVQLLPGLLTSIEIFFLTLLFALPLGLVTALGRMSKCNIISRTITIYISILRGTPLMLQLLMVYFGPYYLFGMSLQNYSEFVAVIIAFSINYSAYFAEIFRGGIQSIPIGQYEAAEVLGYTKRQTFSKIILPQVIKRIVPPTTNEIITLVKDTSLAQVLSVVEMFTMAKRLANAQSSLIALVTAGIFYYIFNFIVATITTKIEHKLDYYR